MHSQPNKQPIQQATRKPYKAPQLTVFGPLSTLTQNGTQNAKENNGKAICGAIFTKSGGTSC